LENIREKIIHVTNNLPTLPTIYTSISESMANPLTTADDIAKIIATDQAAASKVLRVANSPIYGFRGNIDTISKAIFNLGFNEVRNIVLALSVINFFSKSKSIDSFRPIEFWQHSIAVGIGARLIANESGIKNLENYFLAGILHDIGKLLIFQIAPEEYANVLETARNEKMFIRTVEKESFGLDHSTAGRYLADKWKLPEPLKNCISFHHSGFYTTKPDNLLISVHLADVFSRMLNLGFPGDNLVPQPSAMVWDQVKLPTNMFSKILDTLISDYQESVSLLLQD